VILNVNETAHRRPFVTLDASARFKLSTRTSLFISGRNLTNSKRVTIDTFGASPGVWSNYQVTGTTWTFGAKGTF